MSLTILHEDGESTVAGPRVGVAELATATGWQLKPEGLCRGEVCVPVRDRAALVVDDSVSIEALGAALHRPVVVDLDAGVAAIGRDPVAVTADLRDRRAPDFTLPTLSGEQFSLSSVGRRKKVLIAWASW